MKTYILTATLFLAINTIAGAQNSGDDSTASRLVASVAHSKNAAGKPTVDSTVYAYTGEHGSIAANNGEVAQPVKFTTMIKYTNDNKLFVNSRPNLTEQEFDDNDNVNHIYSEHWDYYKQKYIKDTKETITYDAAGRDTLELAQQWDSTETGYQWVNTFKNVFTYSKEPHATTETSYYWNPTQHYWNPGLSNTMVYDTNDNVTANLSYTCDGGRCDTSDYSQSLFEYNNNAFVIKETDIKYNSANKLWDSTERTHYTYNKYNKVLVKVVEQWSPGFGKWINAVRSFYTYDIRNNLASVKTLAEDTSDHSDDKIEVLTYNQFNQPILNSTKQFGAKHALIGDVEEVYYYQSYTTKKKGK